MIEMLYAINRGLDRRFPHGAGPFQIVARLLEESGELAGAVNHLEGAGVKHEKHGPPDKAHLAKEVQDVLRCALQIAQHYGIEEELRASVEGSYRRMQAEGLIE